ncbi:glycoside hydrolase family 2 TIM barrel-domain containing protein [Ruminococcus sp.]|uniref:glycoside hydrolase family 2 TIM barrel-domain containing protein n=1 Tax=Ruminococcus sp. TaxID=41978 RepID=UPI0025CD89CE|nr:glycoside hydrolase family 2 TIM barrel-domain containing protein [Ruminococcus sp.]MBQ8967380.1 DUF4982 domain-containing protein [Ruminococcus sp.]
MKKILFCDGWEFSLNKLGTEYEDARGWQRVDIPHDWLIYDARDLYRNSTGWYRRKLFCSADGMRRSLRFEGVYMNSKVYVNGRPAGEWKYGYSTFEFDITDLLQDGENDIAVRVDHQAPNSRWYSGAGIYRKVWLNEYAPQHIAADGVYVSADIDGNVVISVEVERPENETVDSLSLKAVVYEGGAGGRKSLAETFYSCTAVDSSVMPPTVVRKGCKYSVNVLKLKIDSPLLWDITDPNLYHYCVALFRGDEIIDTAEGRFGFRKAEMTCDKGFFLNERHVKIHGACMHHDMGALGSAVNRYAIKRQLEKLREMGVNAIRTSHNPPSVELLELADEMGMMILDEAFDMWELQKTDYDYGRFFPEWHERDVASWVRRDRNHPCVIGWSIGNEIYDTHAGERGQEITSRLRMLVAVHDPRGNGFITIGSNYMAGENAQKCADILKIPGYNYAERLYDEHHAAHPDWAVYGSETSSVVQSRGIYHFPRSQSIVSEDDEQASSLGNSAPGWAARTWEACIIPDRDAEYCAGQFIWTGFDYIGEPTPYATKNSYFGQYDTAGFAKDSAYVFRSAWTSWKNAPFVHIFPYWDFNEGEMIDIRVASNAPKVALFFNGEKIAEQDFDRKTCKQLTLDAALPYCKGELLAIAYDDKGSELCRDVQRSFGDTAKIRLSPDKTELKADGRDMIFLDISAYDKDGNFVANANDRVTVNVSGAGRLVGLDNGDSTDYDQYKGISRRLFSGKLLAMIAAKNVGGDIRVKVTSAGLPDSEILLSAVEIGPEEFISPGYPFGDECRACENDFGLPEDEKAIRKIELTGAQKNFTADRRELTFKVKILPENATLRDIVFRLTTVTGIDSNLGRIKCFDENTVTVECFGDGEMYLRAQAKNGTDKYHVISAVKLTAEGLGNAHNDPYKMVMGGLYSLEGGRVTHGIQKGVNLREGAWCGFENVDFGEIGADTVTIPIFANYSTPVRIQLWDGTPEDGELLGDWEYFKKPIWLVYQEETFKLKKVLRGIHTISVTSEFSLDIQGFVFEKRAKETAELMAAGAENIYGDKFTREAEAVTGIGNNVNLCYGVFDFSGGAPEKLIIRGRSKLAVNSIHLLFKGEDGSEKRILAEFAGAEDYTDREFPVEGISGKGTVEFVFLPGSDFDFYSFRFL